MKRIPLHYAIRHYYDRFTDCSADSLFAFLDRRTRDDFIREETPRMGNYHWMSATRAEARRKFPKAFCTESVWQPVHLGFDEIVACRSLAPRKIS